MNNDFPRILSLLRKERHISQKDAATALGVAQALLSHYEKGKRECGLDFLVKAADYYNVSTDYLLGRSPMSSGSVIVESDIPEATAQEKVRVGADLSLTLSKKLLTNSIDIIYSILSKIGNSKLNMAVSSILSLTVYKVFRIVFKVNKTDASTMFEFPEEKACHLADAGISISVGEAASAVKESEKSTEISSVTIENDYPKQAPALLSLIKGSETRLKKLI